MLPLRTTARGRCAPPPRWLALEAERDSAPSPHAAKLSDALVLALRGTPLELLASLGPRLWRAGRGSRPGRGKNTSAAEVALGATDLAARVLPLLLPMLSCSKLATRSWWAGVGEGAGSEVVQGCR